MYYRLDVEGNPVAEPDIEKWMRWFMDNEMLVQVAEDYVGDIRISTIFLWCPCDPAAPAPRIWETMVFGESSKMDRNQWRCGGSREQAEAMHAKVVGLVKQELN